MANQLIWLADSKLVKLVMKVEDPLQGSDKAVGFLLAYPDISAALQKTRGRLFPFGWLTLLRELRRTDWININGASLLPEYRGSGGTSILYSEMFQSVTENPLYRHAEIVQIGGRTRTCNAKWKTLALISTRCTEHIQRICHDG